MIPIITSVTSCLTNCIDFKDECLQILEFATAAFNEQVQHYVVTVADDKRRELRSQLKGDFHKLFQLQVSIIKKIVYEDFKKSLSTITL